MMARENLKWNEGESVEAPGARMQDLRRLTLAIDNSIELTILT